MDHLTPNGEQYVTPPSALAALEAERDDLIGRIQHVDAQLAQRKAVDRSFHLECLEAGPAAKLRYFEASADFSRWRGSAIGAKRHMVARLAEVKAQIRDLNINRTDDETYRKYVDLRRAVQAHQAATLTGDYEPTPHDLLLWEAAYLEIGSAVVA